MDAELLGKDGIEPGEVCPYGKSQGDFEGLVRCFSFVFFFFFFPRSFFLVGGFSFFVFSHDFFGISWWLVCWCFLQMQKNLRCGFWNDTLALEALKHRLQRGL